MIRAFFRKKSICLALGLAVLLLAGGAALAETMKVSQPNQQLFPDPDFASTPLASVPVGAEVSVIRQAGDWYKVEFQGKSGWMHRQAFPQAKAPAKLSLPSLLTGGAVKQATSDEVALAGKGFTPEVEAGYRQKHPEANFALVDKVEAFKVDEGQLMTFIKEGGLKP